jgi:Flp pilus assembly protein TadG
MTAARTIVRTAVAAPARPQCLGWGRAGRLLRDERGSATAELTLAAPLLLLMLTLIVQFALWSHAAHVAQAAATEGLAAARSHTGTEIQGVHAARRILDQLADGPLAAPTVEATRDATTASITVSGTVTSVVPMVVLPVRAHVAGPVERFTEREAR